MADWSREWRDHLSERDAMVVERAERDLGVLADRWVRLAGMVAVPEGGAGGGGRAVPGPRVPIRVDVVDLQVEIAAWVREQVSLASGALRAGLTNCRSTVSGIGYLSSNIGSVWMEDPETGQQIAAGAGRFVWRCRRLDGEVSAAFPLDVDCPECGRLALWAHPGRGIVRCGWPECSGEWSAGVLAVMAWQSDGMACGT